MPSTRMTWERRHPEHKCPTRGMRDPVGGQWCGRGCVERKNQPGAGDVGRYHRKFMERHRSPYALGGGGAGYTVNSPSLTGVPVETSHGMFGAQRSKLSRAVSPSLP